MFKKPQASALVEIKHETNNKLHHTCLIIQNKKPQCENPWEGIFFSTKYQTNTSD